MSPESFTQKVYKVVLSIPHGKTMSYKQVAEKAGSPHAYRAVGNIMNKHGVPGLPCHRVIKSSGALGEYRYGKNIKKALLRKEGVKNI